MKIEMNTDHIGVLAIVFLVIAFIFMFIFLAKRHRETKESPEQAKVYEMKDHKWEPLHDSTSGTAGYMTEYIPKGNATRFASPEEEIKITTMLMAKSLDDEQLSALIDEHQIVINKLRLQNDVLIEEHKLRKSR